jgi:hypothetical protein
MKTEAELNAAILKTIMIIKEQYPELTKYLVEMPDTIPNEKNPEINSKTLEEYYDSLVSILKKYAPNHIIQ